MNGIELKNSVILITGGSGSWGNELTRQLLEKFDPKEIRIFSRGEFKQVEMKRRFHNDKIRYIVGDVRDQVRLKQATVGTDIIFHLAALKHVPVCEENPWEAVLTNIIGTQNVIEAAIENKVKRVVDVSTDKAVDPLNLYGVTKACGEKLIIAANNISPETSFVCIRGGNVLGTNGSVVPLFKEQISRANEITITDPKMTRFLMRVEEAIELVLEAAQQAVGGEVMVMKMPGASIVDLAKVMIKYLGNKDTKVKLIGTRPGEKLSEVLVSRYESPRTFEYGKYFLILPMIGIPKTEEHYKKRNLKRVNFDEYSSTNTEQLSWDGIEDLLQRDNWFDKSESGEGAQIFESLSDDQLDKLFKLEGWVK